MKKNIFILPVFFCCLLLISCNNFFQDIFNVSTKDSFSVSLPVWPPEDSLKEYYPPLSRWLITIEADNINTSFYYDLENQVTYNDKDKADKVFSDKENISISNNIITIKTDKNLPLSITALPITKKSDNTEFSFFKPAGFIYPCEDKTSYNCDSPGNKLTWESGFLASVMETMFKEKHNNISPEIYDNSIICSFNWNNAITTIDKNMKESIYNPWLNDLPDILIKIKAKSFSKSKLKHSKINSLEKPSCGEIILSPYIPENENIFRTNKISINYKMDNKFYVYEDKSILFKFSSRNILQESINLPI